MPAPIIEDIKQMDAREARAFVHARDSALAEWLEAEGATDFDWQSWAEEIQDRVLMAALVDGGAEFAKQLEGGLRVCETALDEREETALDRDKFIAAVRASLRSRSGKSWSVTGGRGTAWGWVTIDAPPARKTWRHVPKAGAGECPPPGAEFWDYKDTGRAGGNISAPDAAELAALLGLETVHFQGVSIPAGGDYRREYLQRARGEAVTVRGEPYWD
jgi:hypothetical protein